LKTLGFQGFSLFELYQTDTISMQEKAKNSPLFAVPCTNARK